MISPLPASTQVAQSGGWIHHDLFRWLMSVRQILADLISPDGALTPPSMTTTERNALNATNGMVIFNTTTTKLQVYAGGWADLH